MNEVLNKIGICGPKHHSISVQEFKGFTIAALLKSSVTARKHLTRKEA